MCVCVCVCVCSCITTLLETSTSKSTFHIRTDVQLRTKMLDLVRKTIASDREWLFNAPGGEIWKKQYGPEKEGF